MRPLNSGLSRTSREYEALLDDARVWSPSSLNNTFVPTAPAAYVRRRLKNALASLLSIEKTTSSPTLPVRRDEAAIIALSENYLSSPREAVVSAPSGENNELMNGKDHAQEGTEGISSKTSASAQQEGFGPAAESYLAVCRRVLLRSFVAAGGTEEAAENEAADEEEETNETSGRVMLMKSIGLSSADCFDLADSKQPSGRATCTGEAEELTENEGGHRRAKQEEQNTVPLDCPMYLVLLHQEAAYRRLLLQELDMAFVTLCELGWFERDRLRLSDEGLRTIFDLVLASPEADDRQRITDEMTLHCFQTQLLTQRKSLDGDELVARRAWQREEAEEWMNITTVAHREFFRLRDLEVKRRRRKAGAINGLTSDLGEGTDEIDDLFGGIELPPDALRPPTPEKTRDELLAEEARRTVLSDAANPKTPLCTGAIMPTLSKSPTTAAGIIIPSQPPPSRLAAYKAQRRYRQEIDYRRAYDREKAAIEEEARQREETAAYTITASVAGSSGFSSLPSPFGASPSGFVRGSARRPDPIDRMVAAFSAPDNLLPAIVAIEHSEQAERNQITKGRAAWLAAVLNLHRRYCVLTVVDFRQALSALTTEEAVGRAAVVDAYYYMMLEFCEGLEVLHRRDLAIREIPQATEVVASKEREGWLYTHKVMMQRKDEEYLKGEEHDATMRIKYFEWVFAQTKARGDIEKAESSSRVQNIYNKERKNFQAIADLANLEFPAALERHLRREALLAKLSTTIVWTPETYDTVYLGEADGRNAIGRAQRDVWLRIIADEAKEYLVARKEEATNIEMHKLMAAYDARTVAKNKQGRSSDANNTTNSSNKAHNSITQSEDRQTKLPTNDAATSVGLNRVASLRLRAANRVTTAEADSALLFSTERSNTQTPLVPTPPPRK